jgi:hypothetical protein
MFTVGTWSLLSAQRLPVGLQPEPHASGLYFVRKEPGMGHNVLGVQGYVVSHGLW